MEIVIGIDPGVEGAIAIYDKSASFIVGVTDMPITEQILTTKKRKKSIDGKRLIEMFKAWKALCQSPEDSLLVRIEKVQAFTKQSAIASFNFGYTACWPEALCLALDIPYTFVTPQKWKRYFELQGLDKDVARQYVLQLFPDLQDRLARKKDIDRAEAILIALYED